MKGFKIFDVRPLGQRRRSSVQAAAAQLEALQSRRKKRGGARVQPTARPANNAFPRVIIEAGTPGLGPNYDEDGNPI